MSRTVAEDVVVDKGKAVERLYASQDFQEVILKDFIESTAIDVGSSFEGSESDIEALKAVSYLKRWLEQRVEDAKMIIQSSKESQMLNFGLLKSHEVKTGVVRKVLDKIKRKIKPKTKG